MMKTTEINIRDPYVLLHGGVYYLYGTRSESCWDKMDGFDVYTSPDLENWEGPIEIFHRPENFFADRCFWAPECYYVNGEFVFIATLHGPDIAKGIFCLKSDSPTGPFRYVGRLTPEDWNCIDGTLFLGGETPYLVFSHTLEDTPDGDMCAVALSADLEQAEGEPFFLFRAAEAPWAKPIPFAKAEFGIDGDAYFTDGPTVYRHRNGALSIIWSSWSKCGYAVGVAQSKSGKLAGPWVQCPDPLYPENGGHGMLFETKEGDLLYTLHYPNDKHCERPHFYPVKENGDLLTLTEPIAQ